MLSETKSKLNKLPMPPARNRSVFMIYVLLMDTVYR